MPFPGVLAILSASGNTKRRCNWQQLPRLFSEPFSLPQLMKLMVFSVCRSHTVIYSAF